MTFAAPTPTGTAALADSGWLITGPSDPLLSSYAPFHVLLTPAGLLYRREPPVAVAPRDDAWPTAILTQIASAVPPPAVLPAHPPLPNDRALAAQDDAKMPPPPSGIQRDIDTAALEVQSLANLGLAAEAERAAARAAADGPLTAERHILHAITLLSLRRFQDAADAARRAVYLAPDCPVASLILGVTLHRLGAIEGARRALSAGRALVVGQRADRPVPGSGGESAARLAAAATAQLALLDELRTTLQ